MHPGPGCGRARRPRPRCRHSRVDRRDGARPCRPRPALRCDSRCRCARRHRASTATACSKARTSTSSPGARRDRGAAHRQRGSRHSGRPAGAGGGDPRRSRLHGRDRRARHLRGSIHRRGRDRRVLAVRVIPCLDVDAGPRREGRAASSRSATPAIRSSSRRVTTRKAPTSSCSSTSPRRPMIATRWCTSWSGLPTRCSSRSRSAAAFAASKTCAAMLRAGADKVSLNTAAVNDPDIVRAGADEFGNQCIVVAIDARRRNAGDPGAGWEVVTHGGRTTTGFGRGRVGRARVRSRRGRDPAHVDGP